MARSAVEDAGRKGGSRADRSGGPGLSAVERIDFRRVTPADDPVALERQVAVEAPIAIEFDGIGYAVLMASPVDLEDLAVGFAHAERLIDDVGDVAGIDVHEGAAGTIVRVALAPGCGARVLDRVRHRVSESACGLCGIENLEQALRPLPRLPATILPLDRAVFHAREALSDHQPLNRATGAAHAAAACSAGGAIRLVREDVGRHNAFDKLIGAMLRGRVGWDGGFALLSSRCSYELVEKAVLAGCPLLATVSAPTSLAVARAREAGLALRVLARADALLAIEPA